MQPSRIQGRRWVISSFEENQQAAVEVASQAKRWISIYTPDLEPGIYDSDEFLDVAKRLVLAKRYARIRVLISEPHRTVRIGNRLVAVGRRLNSYIEFRNVHPDYQEHREAYLIADDIAVLYRVEGRKWEGIADTYEPPVARRYLQLFEEIWNASELEQELRELRV
ncbi:MAG: hypothetical protein D6727_00445 [Gammaproteobacteria bacterium]|nr:MAG: hypothetical protein D6727_00445 [Gammaproteobacteria bacterium]